MGGKISNGILIYPVRNRTLKNIYNSFQEKLLLLNSGNYKVFKYNYIFITDENLIHETELNEMITQFLFSQKGFNYKFDRIYIYIYGDNLYELNLEDEKYTIYTLNSAETYKISTEARRLVEKKELEM